MNKKFTTIRVRKADKLQMETYFPGVQADQAFNELIGRNACPHRSTVKVGESTVMYPGHTQEVDVYLMLCMSCSRMIVLASNDIRVETSVSAETAA